jgi:hypothetical protein
MGGKVVPIDSGLDPAIIDKPKTSANVAVKTEDVGSGRKG